MPWDPATYHKFQAERFAPFNDLLRLIVYKRADLNTWMESRRVDPGAR